MKYANCAVPIDKMADRKDSRRQENRWAKTLVGKVSPGSGNGWLHKSDVRSKDVLVEAKITSAKSYSLKDAELQVNIHHALMDGLSPIFVVEFKPSGNSYVILTEDDYLGLRQKAELSGNEAENNGTGMV